MRVHASCLTSQPLPLVATPEDIFLDDVTVSRRHAEFRIDGDKFEVVDVDLNGTYVNREPRNSQELEVGDEIQIGKFRLVFIANKK